MTPRRPKHYKVGRGQYAERVRGYSVKRYVRRVSHLKTNLINHIKEQHRAYKKTGFLHKHATLSKKQGYHTPKRSSKAIIRGIRTGTIARKRATLGHAIRAASRSGTHVVESSQISTPITVHRAPPSGRPRPSHATRLITGTAGRRIKGKTRAKKLGAAVVAASRAGRSDVTSVSVPTTTLVVPTPRRTPTPVSFQFKLKR